MNLLTRIKIWTGAKIIAQTHAVQDLQYKDAATRQSCAVFGVYVLSLIAISSGLLSITAMNWNAISDSTKLVCYIYILSLLLLGVCTIMLKSQRESVKEVLLTVYCLYTMTGILLVGQIYNSPKNGLQATIFWLTVTLPVILAFKKNIPYQLWRLVLIIAITYWLSSNDYLLSEYWNNTKYNKYIAAGLPFILFGLASIFESPRFSPLCRTVQLWSYIVILIVYAATSAQDFSGSPTFGVYGDEVFSKPVVVPFSPSWFTVSIVAVIVAVVGTFYRKSYSGKIITTSQCIAIIAMALLTLIPLCTCISGNIVLWYILFLTAWICTAITIALSIGNKWLVSLAALSFATLVALSWLRKDLYNHFHFYFDLPYIHIGLFIGATTLGAVSLLIATAKILRL